MKHQSTKQQSTNHQQMDGADRSASKKNDQTVIRSDENDQRTIDDKVIDQQTNDDRDDDDRDKNHRKNDEKSLTDHNDDDDDHHEDDDDDEILPKFNQTFGKSMYSTVKAVKTQSTEEQLREFDLVLEQVKERSTTTPPTIEKKTILQKVNFPVIVLTKLTQSSSSSSSNQSSSPSSPSIKNKSQEDEQTVQRINDILAEYAEQLRNSPDLNNKPAPRRRSNPPTNPPPITVSSMKKKKSSIDDDPDELDEPSIIRPQPQQQQRTTVLVGGGCNGNYLLPMIKGQQITILSSTPSSSFILQRLSTSTTATTTATTTTNSLKPIFLMTRTKQTENDSPWISKCKIMKKVDAPTTIVDGNAFKTISEECEDLGVDEPSTSELFPEADLLFDQSSQDELSGEVKAKPVYSKYDESKKRRLSSRGHVKKNCSCCPKTSQPNLIKININSNKKIRLASFTSEVVTNT